jgi:hypothetical protein
MTLHPDFSHFIKAPERCKGLKTTTKCSLSPFDHYMLYSISVPNTTLPGRTAAIFEEIFALGNRFRLSAEAYFP